MPLFHKLSSFPNQWIAVVGVSFLYIAEPTASFSKKFCSHLLPQIDFQQKIPKMRKTRLVILPTKCLHQMGFLLLFLSCPVIGDWGRIRPDSENSHNAIQIDREGTCGLERDPPGGLVDFLNETGFKQCRSSEALNENESVEKQFDERLNPQRNLLERRTSEKQIAQRRTTNERRDVRREAKTELRRMDERIRRETQRDVRRETERNVRSRSVEPRRSVRNRNEVRARSLSRLDNERNIREESFRRFNHENRRLERTKKNNVRQSERRVEEQRLRRELLNDRRQNLRERDTSRNINSEERERRDITRRSTPENSIRRSNDQIRRQLQDRVQNIRERRLSLARNELNYIRRIENRRITDSNDLQTRRTRESREIPGTVRSQSEIEREPESRRLSLQKDRRDDIRERRTIYVSERLEEKQRRVSRAANRREFHSEPELNLKNFGKDHSGEIEKWTDLTSFKAGDWTTNCVIGAVVYFYTTRQVKTV